MRRMPAFMVAMPNTPVAPVLSVSLCENDGANVHGSYGR
jgi:hypothetical protein